MCVCLVPSHATAIRTPSRSSQWFVLQVGKQQISLHIHMDVCVSSHPLRTARASYAHQSYIISYDGDRSKAVCQREQYAYRPALGRKTQREEEYDMYVLRRRTGRERRQGGKDEEGEAVSWCWEHVILTHTHSFTDRLATEATP